MHYMAFNMFLRSWENKANGDKRRELGSLMGRPVKSHFLPYIVADSPWRKNLERTRTRRWHGCLIPARKWNGHTHTSVPVGLILVSCTSSPSVSRECLITALVRRAGNAQRFLTIFLIFLIFLREQCDNLRERFSGAFKKEGEKTPS